jgi:hypothetical protein
VLLPLGVAWFAIQGLYFGTALMQPEALAAVRVGERCPAYLPADPEFVPNSPAKELSSAAKPGGAFPSPPMEAAAVMATGAGFVGQLGLPVLATWAMGGRVRRWGIGAEFSARVGRWGAEMPRFPRLDKAAVATKACALQPEEYRDILYSSVGDEAGWVRSLDPAPLLPQELPLF